MKFSVKSESPENQCSACIIVGVFEQCHLSLAAQQVDRISGNYISSLLNHEDLKGKLGETLLLYNVPSLLSKRVLLVGCGKKSDLDQYQYKKIIQKMIQKLNKIGSKEAICFLTDLSVKKQNTYWKIRQAIETIQDNLYSFEKFKTTIPKFSHRLGRLEFNVLNSNELVEAEKAMTHALAIASGIKASKDLGNMPPNIANPTYLSSQALKMASKYDNIITTIISENEMKELGMAAYLAVGYGSKNESSMSIIEYKGNPNAKAKPIVLVGKGLTFDSGGISLKPSEKMDEMKYDMCGAASVFGTMKALARLDLPINVVAILAGCENMPSSDAYRPGDILTTMSGQTVEVLNTDAEGRLVLCDVLTYVQRFDPDCIIDIATLTGACVIALGHHVSALMSNHHPLACELISASEQANDQVWQLPILNDYQEQIKSKFADIANIGDRSAGAITAACFLSRFTKKYHWAHIDIAGTAWKSKGSTGRPVSMLVQFLLNRSKAVNKK
ncbi:cytosol aminopeptidase [Candidatus Photodesmus katoptron]|uniref:Probable cytosol aminopeptidase n=1 Tax=Candidatus Photodesmus katoptron Akat1 TaxID=1236703 RepID=S3DZF0_9GAMM|nr:leucyl aminopeptidase [Candidatus Photodesmus katoptron]EPE37276.1 cytosol aminopeptidase [Candidatus Photodesmus katoptron Akat1]KEY90067.1 cytosol aminopeptidase [Candidatus Photodesmus katoptron]